MNITMNMKFRVESADGRTSYHRSEKTARRELKRRGGRLEEHHADGGKYNRRLEWEWITSAAV